MYLELVVQSLDVVLHPLDELRLVLTDGPSDVRPDEEGIVAREDAEHLVGIPGRPQLVPQAGCDPGLHSVDPLVVPLAQEVEIWYTR